MANGNRNRQRGVTAWVEREGETVNLRSPPERSLAADASL
jgi:hypothetical protein